VKIGNDASQTHNYCTATNAVPWHSSLRSLLRKKWLLELAISPGMQQSR